MVLSRILGSDVNFAGINDSSLTSAFFCILHNGLFTFTDPYSYSDPDSSTEQLGLESESDSAV